MEVHCYKELNITTYGRKLKFKIGDTFEVFSDTDGGSYILKDGFKLRYSTYNREFLKYFKEVDLEWEEQKKRLGINE